MKKQVTYLLIALCSALLFSCHSGKKEDKTVSGADSLTTALKAKHFYTYDLSKFGYQLSIMVPDSTIGLLSVNHKNNGDVEINVGRNFGIDVSVGDAGDLALLKSDLKGNLVFKSTILQSDSNSILYEKVIPNTTIKPQYHFLYVVKLGGSYYDVKSIQMNTYAKGSAAKMLEAAHTLALVKPKAKPAV